jgi:hypothetical protein
LRRAYALIVAVLCTGVAMLSATLLAHAVGPTRIDGWLPPTELSQSGDTASRGPRISLDGLARIHVLWTDAAPADPHYVRSLDQGTTWSSVQSIATGNTSYQSALAAGGTGVAHACWWEQVLGPPTQNEILYAKRSGSGWGAAATAVITTSEIQEPDVLEASSYVNVVWSNKLSKNFDLCYARKSTEEAIWEDPVIITDTAYTSFFSEMAADRSGNLHVVWQENTSPNEIMYISGTVGMDQTSWFEAITLTADLDLNSTTPSISVGQDDVVHVVFGADVAGLDNTQDLYHVSFPISNTSGISPTLIPGSRVFITQQLPNYASPSLAQEGANTLHVVWNGVREGDLWDRVYYATSGDGGASWSHAVPVSPDDAWPDGFPDVIAYAGIVHVVWQQETSGPDNDIFYSHSLPWVIGFTLVMNE